MSDYIKKEDAMNAAADYVKWLNPDSPAREIFALQIQTKISKIPAADVIERKHGYWDGYDKVYFKSCSECGCLIPSFATLFVEKSESEYNFCPNCGADMRGDSNV